MRIVVLGATSRTGLQLLAQARRRGHQIVAFTRRPEALPDSAALAAVVRGDGRDPGALTGALAGADAAISAARRRPGRPAPRVRGCPRPDHRDAPRRGGQARRGQRLPDSR
jgi:uncharacterized protein YbjT (DUF2867 family)